MTGCRKATARRARAFAGVFLAIGLVSRIAPLANAEGRLLQQFPTEDGYLMLTIARNVGLGHGMSIADGTIPTNGTQPLTTLLWGAVFWAVDGDREAGVAGVLVLEILFSLAACALLYAVAARLWRERPSGQALAALTATAWFASVATVRHSMNCLESGAYVATVLLFALLLLRARPADATRPRIAAFAKLGALLGVAFWVRVDAVLLCVAFGFAHLAGVLPPWRAPFAARMRELVVAAVVCAAVAAPWLAHNFLRFGSVMPVSGQSEGHDVRFGQELENVPIVLAEYGMVVVQIPTAWESERVVFGACLLAVLGVAAFGLRELARAGPAARTVAIVFASFGAALALFYGLFFGAGYFMGRYLFPVSPFVALLSVHLGTKLGAHLASASARETLGRALAVAAAVALVALNLRLYAAGKRHEHAQVVAWVQANVPDEVWVAAPQSGTLGFMHDRTLNLDGKVNPAAMQARRRNQIPEYLAASPAQYVVDWWGLVHWVGLYPQVRDHFELIVEDRANNLTVLRRRRPATAGG